MVCQVTWPSLLLQSIVLLLCYRVHFGSAVEECVDEAGTATCEELTQIYGCGTYWPNFQSKGTFVGYACRKTCGQCSFPTTGPNYKVQNNALKTLYASTNGDHWVKNALWLNGTVGHCEWFGVYCDHAGNITAL